MILISLSILEYERYLKDHLDDCARLGALSQIISLVQTGKIHRVHIDVMRPPMIPDKTAFPVELIGRVYGELHDKIRLAVHLMVREPLPIIKEINKFVPRREREKMNIIIQVESFSSEERTVKALNLVKEFGYKAGICLDLPTPREALTQEIMGNADTVLLMSVPMGRGGQEYNEKATERIAFFSLKSPGKTIEVDGGINPETIVAAWKAGAKIAVVGSFIARSRDPLKAVSELERSLGG